jgi:N-acetylmuramoyl-L-alanine amidase
MIPVRRLLALLILVLGVAPSLAVAATRLTGVELTADGAGARLTLQLGAKVDRRVFALDSPDRVVIDLPGVRAASGLRLPAGAGPVATVRSGARPGDTLRLVVELAQPLASATRWVRAGQGWQLVVDLGKGPGGRPASGASPAPRAAGVRASLPAAGTAVAADAPVQALRPAHAPADTGRDVIVAIDAGHGGQDPGAIGRGGTREKDVVLEIARALARRVDAEPGMKAYLTRDSDRFLVLRDRIDRARAARADLFVSVHADSIGNRAVSGSSVYVLSERGASSEAARWLAESENAADLKGGVSLSGRNGALASVLMDLSQTASIGSSMEAAERVLTHLDRVGNIRKSQVQQAGFLVLKSPDIPSMLVETAYISNPSEERNLRSPGYQQALAEAIFSGIRDYFRASPPDGSWFAQARARGGGGAVVAAGAAPP